jgi:hypothetical protein
VPSDDERFQTALGNLQRSAFAGVLVVLPGLALVALDAPQWLSIGYLGLVVVVLAPYVIWQRRQSRRP